MIDRSDKRKPSFKHLPPFESDEHRTEEEKRLFLEWNRRLRKEGLGVFRGGREIPLPPEVLERIPRNHFHQRRRISLPLEILSPRQKTVIEGLFFEGVSEEELARRLNISRSSVRIHRDRALEKLRRVLENTISPHRGKS